MISFAIKNLRDRILSQVYKPKTIIGYGKNILSDEKEVVGLDWDTLNRHVYILGSTGAGKTTLLRNIAYQAVRQGYGLLFVDLKGGHSAFETIKDIYLACLETKREKDFYYLSPVSAGHLKITSATWNPVYYGSKEIVANKLFDALRNLSEDAKFYEDVKLDILYKLVAIPKAQGKIFTLGQLAKALSSIEKLEEFANLGTGKEKHDVLQLVSEWESNKMQFVKNIKGTLVALQMLSSGLPAKILETFTPSLDLSESLEKRKITYCLLPTLLARESMRQIAKMLISELKTITGDFLTQNKKTKTVVVIDEFEEILFPGVKDLFNKARESGIALVVSHQTVADIEHEVSESFARSIIDNTNTKVFMMLKSPKSCQMASEIVGMYPKLPILSKWISATPIIPPEVFAGENEIYDAGLKVGEAIVKIDAKTYRVKVPYSQRREKIVMGRDIPFPSPEYVEKKQIALKF